MTLKQELESHNSFHPQLEPKTQMQRVLLEISFKNHLNKQKKADFALTIMRYITRGSSNLNLQLGNNSLSVTF